MPTRHSDMLAYFLLYKNTSFKALVEAQYPQFEHLSISINTIVISINSFCFAVRSLTHAIVITHFLFAYS